MDTIIIIKLWILVGAYHVLVTSADEGVPEVPSQTKQAGGRIDLVKRAVTTASKAFEDSNGYSRSLTQKASVSDNADFGHGLRATPRIMGLDVGDEDTNFEAGMWLIALVGLLATAIPAIFLDPSLGFRRALGPSGSFDDFVDSLANLAERISQIVENARTKYAQDVIPINYDGY